MMKKTFLSKMLVVLITLILMLTACTPATDEPDATPTPAATTTPATTGDQTDEPSDLEEVELIWHNQVDVVRPDTAMVIEELNKYLKEEINATIDYHSYISADYKEKLPTMINSQQKMDIVFTGNAYNFVTNAQQGAFLPLNDLIEEYMPNTKAVVPEQAWNAVTFDGNIYAIVPYKDLSARWSLLYNKTMTDELGVEVPADASWTTFRDLIPFLYEVKEARDEKMPDLADIALMKIVDYMEAWYPYESISGKLAIVNIPGLNAFEGQGDGETVFNMYATDEYRQFVHDIKKLVDDGIFPYDNLNFDPDNALLNSHKLLAQFPQGYIEILGDMYPGRETAHTVSDLALMSNGYVRAFLQAISVQSDNPERAAMFLELVNSDPVVANLLRFGIEDQHYEVVSEGRIDVTNSPRNGGGRGYQDYGYYFWYGGQFGNILAGHTPIFVSDEFSQKLDDLNNSAVDGINLGFTFDQTPVANEIAATANVIEEYDSRSNLLSGMVTDVDATVDDFLKKLEDNGVQKIIDEAQRQLTEWRAAQGMPTK
jgi:putative aldouronate transport system substrate-binding protein